MKKFFLFWCYFGLIGLLLGLNKAHALALSHPPVVSDPAPSSYEPNGNAVMPDLPGQAPIQGGVEKQSRQMMLRQLQAQHYTAYTQKMQALRSDLAALLDYLNSLQPGALPSLQRIGAYNAQISIDWSGLKPAITPTEQRFKSYQEMETAVVNLQAMTHSWIQSNRVEIAIGTTRNQETQTRNMVTYRTEKIRTALNALEAFDKAKAILNEEIPY